MNARPIWDNRDVSSLSEIAEFLRARLDEDEQVARQEDEDCAGTTLLPTYDSEHQARWNTARVLREVEAKRRLVDRSVAEIEGQDPPRASAIFASGVLLVLALPYADHPEYPERWRQ